MGRIFRRQSNAMRNFCDKLGDRLRSLYLSGYRPQPLSSNFSVIRTAYAPCSESKAYREQINDCPMLDLEDCPISAGVLIRTVPHFVK